MVSKRCYFVRRAIGDVGTHADTPVRAKDDPSPICAGHNCGTCVRGLLACWLGYTWHARQHPVRACCFCQVRGEVR